MINYPYTPVHSLEWLEKYFSKNYNKKKYDRFMWWRSYSPKSSPLSNRHPFRDRIINGDYDMAPYRFEAEIVEHRMNRKFELYRADDVQYREQTALDAARRKRLMDDFEKEERKRLEDLRVGFTREFKMTKEDYDVEVVNTNSNSLLKFYEEMEKKYGTRAIPPAPFPSGLVPAWKRCR
jgi:hypothetical protein